MTIFFSTQCILHLSFVIFRTSLSPHLRAAFLMLLRVYINLHYYCHEWWYSLFFLGGFVVKFILNLIFKLTSGTSLTACFLFFNQVLTIWGKSLASRWAWAIRTLLPSLVATPWFVAVYSCLLHSNLICMHACIDVVFLSFSSGKVPQGAVWFWGALD